METIFLDRNLAHEKLKKHPPTHIAVAYVGRDWDQLIDCSQLKEIIVSPTLGTNPRAVAEIAEQIGWDHVHFLDELHAKIYLSAHAVILGSFNLSRNALDCSRNNGLLEAGIFSLSPDMIKNAKDFYDLCKYKAIRQYTSVDAKKIKLSHLELIRNQAIEKNIILEPEHENLSQNTIYPYLNEYKISFFVNDDKMVVDDNALIDGVTIKDAGLTVKSNHCFAKADAKELERGQWILAWRIKKNENKPYSKYSKNNFYWMYIHNLVLYGYKNNDSSKDYPLVAFEWEGQKTPKPPFELDEDIYEAFKQTLADSRFLHFSEVEHSIWTISKGNHDVESFVDVWRENLAKLSN